MSVEKRLQTYQITALAGLFFALIGFAYSAWRMELTEQNSNIRTAAFEILLEMAELEQLVYAAHYDQNPQEGNPRKGWVKVGLINDLSALVNPAVQKNCAQLKQVWTQDWDKITGERAAADRVVKAIDAARSEVKNAISTLE